MRSSPAPTERDPVFVASTAPLPPWKRTIDIGCCLLALPLLLAVMAFVAAVHAVSSRGAMFFRQERVGYMGRRFTLFKFRTMHAGADTAIHRTHVANLVRSQAPLRKMDCAGDARLVPFGWIMRATGLDELPQIINVLRGEMSIVGPRPCIPYEYEQYAPWHRARFNAVPGLTGLWQVSGKNRTTFDEMIRLDIRYCETRSLGQDIRIIALTLPALWIEVLDTRSGRRMARATVPGAVHSGNPEGAPFQTWNTAP
jgi:lipopolysaccharide/colanic/teichoic acid biosynthesis glycosyltransferase